MKITVLCCMAMMLLLAQIGFGVIISATDNLDGTCLIEMNTENGESNIVAMGLEIDCSVGQILGVDITSYNPLMNIYPDYAHDEESYGDGYQYGEGHPIASDNEAGAISLPSNDFTISATMLNGPDIPGADGYARIRFLLSANEDVVGTIQENLLRGGVVAVDGIPLDIHPEQLNFTISIPEPATLSLLALGAFFAGRRKRN